MNSGLASHLTRGKLFNTRGTHQKFDRAAFKLIENKINPKYFPTRTQILKFEGAGGPDGLKFKGNYKTDHLWDPVNKIGYLPDWVAINFKHMSEALTAGDTIQAAFEAGFMAHYLTDSLTPAHHLSHKLILEEYEGNKYRKRWKVYGHKGLMSSHVAFETGISSAILFSTIKVKFDEDLFKRIKKDGIKKVVEEESLAVAKLNLYEQFLKKGWNAALAKSVKATVVKRIPQLIAAAWLAAYEEAGIEVSA